MNYSNPLTDYSPQMEFADEFMNVHAEPQGVVLSENDETELAAEFLTINSEAEMDQFLGDFVHKIGHKIGKWVNSPQGQQLVGVLKGVAKTALPIAGGALGTFVGGPAGALIGSNLASMAGSLLGLELEGLSPEDRELEASRQFIRFASQTVANALKADPRGDAHGVAQQAAREAARIYAPGLLDISNHAQRRQIMNHDMDRTQVGFAQGEGDYEQPYGGAVLNEEENENLAAGLMEVNSEEELDNFLGDIISGVANTVGKFISSPTGQALGSGLKDVAKQLLPVAGTALGTYIGGPVGAQIGGTLGSAAGGMLEAESEERDWEAAHQFVKLAAEATKNAAEMPQGDPHATAQKAIVEAAKVHAPHLVPLLTNGHEQGHYGHHRCHHCARRRHQHGRWFRHGDRVILVGV